MGYKILFTNVDLVAWLVIEQALPIKNSTKYFNGVVSYVYKYQREHDLYTLKKVIIW